MIWAFIFGVLVGSMPRIVNAIGKYIVRRQRRGLYTDGPYQIGRQHAAIFARGDTPKGFTDKQIVNLLCDPEYQYGLLNGTNLMQAQAAASEAK